MDDGDGGGGSEDLFSPWGFWGHQCCGKLLLKAGFCLGEVPKIRFLGMKGLEQLDVNRQSPFLHQESQE